MDFPFQIEVNVPELFSSSTFMLNFYGGITTFLGPNGSGKSQVLRELKNTLSFLTNTHSRKVRLITAGRLSQIENYRSNVDGMRGGINYEGATFGGTNLRQYRHQAEGAIGDFHTLSMRPDIQIKVSQRLSTLFNRNILIDWDAGNLKINFSALDGKPYSSAREASGLLQLVAILSALYDNEVGVLLLDEPEISLHPQLQSFLFQEIKRIAGHPSEKSKKMIIMATHSTEFLDILDPEDLTKIVFFENTINPPVQINPNAGELKSQKVKELLTRLGQAHKAAFFSSRPLLVEGPSDEMICKALNYHLDIFMEAGGSQIVPVIGKGDLPTVVKLMRLIGKKPVVLTDLDTFVDDITFIDIFSTSTNIIEKVHEMGHGDLISFSRPIYNDFMRIINDYWKDLLPLAEKNSYWINRKDENKGKRRSGMATLFKSTDEQISELNNSQIFYSIKKRLLSLFDTLELAGCFILRKGTIEDYYQTGKEIINNKPNAAVEEIQQFLNMPKEKCIEIYSDIVRALQYSAATKEINENKAIANYLLAVISPALGMLNESVSGTELQLNAKKLLGEVSTIFKLSKIDNDGNLKIRVELNSDIIEVKGFPIDFPKGGNPIEIVKNNLNL